MTRNRAHNLVLAAVLCATSATTALYATRPASADGCDITSDSCDSLAAIVALRLHVAEYVPGAFQHSFHARLDRIDAGTTILEEGDNPTDLFAVLISYLKMAQSETRQDRENSRQEWRVEFLPTLTADVDAVISAVCSVVLCPDTEE